MKLMEGLPQLLGKRICGAVVKEADRSPHMQIFLVFDDDTHYEFYSTDGTICGAGGVDPGNIEYVRQYMGRHPIVFECEAQTPHKTSDLFIEDTDK